MIADARGAFCHLVHRVDSVLQSSVASSASSMNSHASAREQSSPGWSVQGNSNRTTLRPLHVLKTFYLGARRPRSGTPVQGRGSRVPCCGRLSRRSPGNKCGLKSSRLLRVKMRRTQREQIESAMPTMRTSTRRADTPQKRSDKLYSDRLIRADEKGRRDFGAEVPRCPVRQWCCLVGLDRSCTIQRPFLDPVLAP